MKPLAYVITPAAAILLFVASGSSTVAQTGRVTFATPTANDLGSGDPIGHVSGDFNQDGHADLVATPYVDVLQGDGTGSLARSAGFTFFNASGIAAADFTGDGALDVAITQAADKGFGYGDLLCGSLPSVGIFVAPQMAFRSPCLFAGYGPVAAQAHDFDGDGTADLAVISRQSQGLRIFRGRGNGAFVQVPTGAPNEAVPGSFISAIAMASPADVTGDGVLDLVVAHTAGIRIFEGKGDGTFAPGITAGSTAMKAVAVADVTADGVADVVTIDAPINPVTRLPAPGHLVAFLGAADGTFTEQVIATIGLNLSDVAIADLDHDGHQDIIVAHEGGGVIHLFFGSGDGTFAADPPLALSVRPKLLAIRDWDEDGDSDIAILDRPVLAQPARVWVALQEGSGPDDATPPVVTLTSPTSGRHVRGTIAVTATASDDVGVIRVEFYAGATLIAKSAGPDFTVTWSTKPVPDGPITLTARAFDARLNESVSSTVDVVVDNASAADTQAPVVSVPENVTIEANGPDGAAYSFEASATDDVDGSVPVTCEPASGSTFPLGVTPVVCSATDAHANTGSVSFAVAVTDTTPPSVTVPEDVTITATESGGAQYTFVASATDVVDGDVAVTCTPASGSTFPVGTTTVDCSATDAQHNLGTASFTVTVTANDETPPVITVPASAVIEATGSGGAVFAYSVSATDDIDGDVPVTCIPPSGATFAIAETLVECTATDAGGNIASASFTVTVTDTTPPVVRVPGDATLTTTELAGASFTYVASALDIVDRDLGATCTPASGSTFPIGTTRVTCTATDAHRNTASASFAVTVVLIDTTPPLITVPANATIEATGASGAVFTYSASATDNIDGAVPVTCVPPSGATFAVGTTIVTCAAADAHGNSATASFTVTVVSPPPVATFNRAPVAQSANYSIRGDVSLSAVLKAKDRDGDALRFLIVGNPAKGAVVLNAATGAFAYTPQPDAQGRDEFAFQVSDGKTLSNVAAVTISIKEARRIGGIASSDAR